MTMSLRENITAVIETCFSETKEEIQEVAINKILELIRNDTADRKTEPTGYNLLPVEDEPQTEDEILRKQCRAFMGIVEQTERIE